MLPKALRSNLPLWALGLATAAVPLACGSSADKHAAAPGFAGSSGSSSGGKSGSGNVSGGGKSQTGGRPSAGTTSSGDAGESAGGQDGGAPTSSAGAGDGENGGAPDVVMPGGPFVGNDPYPCTTDDAPAPSFSAECGPSKSWGMGERIDVDAAADATLVAVTPDELTLVWSEEAGSVNAYYVADRASKQDAFGKKVALDVSGVLATSPDGRRLALLSDDQSALFEATRAERGSDFAAPVAAEFSVLNADAAAKGWSFSAVVFAPDDHTLYYVAGGFAERYPLHVSIRNGDEAWPAGEALKTCEFEAHSTYPRYPTGASSDGKTLFFYDAWRGKTRAAWRADSSGPFSWFHDVGDWFAVQPNSACDRLYYSAGDAAAALVSAPSK